MAGNDPTDNLYVTGLPYGTDSQTLQEIFGRLGTVASCKVLAPKQQGGKCAAFVQYSAVEEAQAAVDTVATDASDLGLDEGVICKFADSPSSWGKGGQTGQAPPAWQQPQQSSYASYGKGKSAGGTQYADRAAPYGKGAKGAQKGAKKGAKGTTYAAIAPTPAAGGGFGGASATATSNLYVSGLPTDIDDTFLSELFGQYGAVESSKALQPKQPGGKRAGFVKFSTKEEAVYVQEQLHGAVPEGLEEAISVTFAQEPGTSGAAPPSQPPVHVAPPAVRPRPAVVQPALRPSVVVRPVSRPPVAAAQPAVAARGGNQGGHSYGTAGAADAIVKHFKQSGCMPGGAHFQNDDNALYVEGLPADFTDNHLYRLFASFGAISPDGARAVMNEQGECKGIGFVNYLMHESAEAAIETYNDSPLPNGGFLKVRIKNKASSKGKGKAADARG